jgi:hypothetical protein
LNNWQKTGLNNKEGYFTDANYVNGLLQLLVQKNKETYFTRGAMVLRLASCLEDSGYLIGGIHS